jgi:8-amino-7-oxononanoate synthase
VTEFDIELSQRLALLRQQGLLRELRRVDSAQGPRIEIGGRTLLNFSSNDYLGLANHPALKEAAIKAVERFGSGSGASRLICGSLAPHHELEATLAAWKGTEAALTFASGYATAVGTICALVGKGDTIFVDRLVHACVIDAARLSGAKLRVFPHNDLNSLARALRRTDERDASAAAGPGKRLIVTESVFSMDGDSAPLVELVELKERFGAWLMLDEAHATGLLGQRRSGLAEECGVVDRVEVQMGTLGKAVGAAGGYVCGSRALVDYLVNRARSFIFSTAPAPATAAAARCGVELIQGAEGEERCRRVWARVEQLKNALAALGFPPMNATSAILPLLLGCEARAVALADALRDEGLFAPAIRFPTVARGAARVRITVTADHTEGDVAVLARALRNALPKLAEGT